MIGFRTMVCAVGLWSGACLAGEVRIEGPAERVALVELFTSEGCSSCPPADRWLSGFVSSPDLWRTVVPVAFHVDYWDYIGWADRFATPAFSERQGLHRAYGHVASVYTPGFVVGGEEWRGWFRGQKFPDLASKPVGPIVLTLRDGAFHAEYSPALELPGRMEVHVAVLGFGLETPVKAGENRGRMLRHDFVVLGHDSFPLREDGDRLVAVGTLPRPRVESARSAIAAWVSPVGSPFPVQSVGAWLGE